LEKADIQKYVTFIETIPSSLKDTADLVSDRLQAALFARDWMKARRILDGSATGEFALGYCNGGVPREAGEIWLLRFQGASPTPEPRFEDLRRRVIE
jgi:hypothetical protein